MAEKLKLPTMQAQSNVDLSGLAVGEGSLAATLDRVYDNATDFGQALNSLAEQLSNNSGIVVKRAVFMLVERLIMTTPVDTGRCMAGWQVSVDSESDCAPPPGDYPNVNISKFFGLPYAKEIYNIENNVEYVLPLENGHSKQAPSGFIANGLASFADYFEKCAAELGFEATP
ncbi:MAG: hypothetical protein HQK81_12325 [Desulfovibrionaceae bacterium]|nr:hypothetical protein [Desulfovibrionaceae bacterium]MBF0514829.1 hypothetical protein [Desulfovibrionaceae bacterium]